jgi:hypothetical protein
MAEITILDLINNLIDNTYDTGWTAGAIEQGRNDLRDIQQAGISKRGVAKEWLLREVAELESLRAEVAELKEGIQDTLDMAWELVPSRSAPVLKDTRAGIINKLSALLK